jgi:hypothetical protein
MLDPIGSSAFIFIAGISTVIALRARFSKAELTENYTKKIIRREYFFRALLILLIALIYNVSIAIALFNPLYIWTWFVLLTIAISLLIAWPLYKISIYFRIIIGIAIWIFNQYFLRLLLPYQGKANIYGILFHIFYHSLDLDVILAFFPFFIFGTVIGEFIFNIYQIKNNNLLKKVLKKKFIYPFLLIGFSLIIFGVLLNFPQFFTNRTFSWMIYTIGIDISLLTVFIVIEEFIQKRKAKRISILFYFSFYSFTIYISHNALYFLFYKQLTVINIWFFIILVYLLVGYSLKIVYKRFGNKVSIKYQIGRLAAILAKRTTKV